MNTLAVMSDGSAELWAMFCVAATFGVAFLTIAIPICIIGLYNCAKRMEKKMEEINKRMAAWSGL